MSAHTIAITGSSGFIGKALTDYFIGLNRYIRGIDLRDRIDVSSNLFTCAKHNLLITTENLNLRDTSALIHLAGYTGVANDPETDEIIVDYNVDVTDNALQLCHDNQIPLMINASSSCVYGLADLPFTEHCQLKPISRYGLSKAKAEERLEQKAKELGVIVFTFRLFNMVGRYQRTNLLPWMALEAMAGRRPPIPLYGIRHRAYTWVEDFARCCAFLIDRQGTLEPGHYVFNFGSPTSLSQIRLFDEIEKITKGVVPYVISDPRDCDMVRTLPDMSNVEKYLGNFISQDGLVRALKDLILYFKQAVGQ